MRTLVLSAILVVLILAGCSERDPVPVSAGRVEEVLARAPSGDVTALVIYLSDRSGWNADDTTNVDALVGDGAAVIPIDLSRYAAKLDADTGSCLYVVGELTDLAQKTQRALGLAEYLPPILVGRAQGATFAYAALADAPANTLGGAVGVGFQNKLALRLPFCPGATATPLPGEKGYSYAFDHALPASARLLVAGADFDLIKAAASTQPNADVEPLLAEQNTSQMLDAVLSMRTESQVAGLPVVPIKAQGMPRGLVVFVSGDGGWRDLDKTMGEWMATQGYDVMGIDALRYFWSEKSPEQFAQDLQKIIAAADPSGALPVLFVGYSYGAEALPFAWAKLPPALQKRVHLVALLAPGLKTGFQISVAGWLGISGGTNDVVPAIAAMPASKVLCVHGALEKESACVMPELAGVTRIETNGGHHFDGDYITLGKKILDAFEETAT